jgi:hypothetical protein
MIVIVGLTGTGVSVAKNPSNPQTDEYRVLHFLYDNNNQANRDTIARFIFGGDMFACNRILKSLKSQHLIAYRGEGLHEI